MHIYMHSIYTSTVYTYKNRNATLYRCTTLNFDNLKELIQFTLFTFGSRQNFKDFCFSTIIEKFKTPSDFSASSPVCRSQLKKTMILWRNAWACISRIVVHFQTVFVIVCWNISVASQTCQKCMYYVSGYLQTWTTEPGDQSVHQLML